VLLGDAGQNPGSQSRTVEVEVLYTPRQDGVNFTKQVKINGVSKRSMDLVGVLRSVLFLPEDVELVAGAPSERRRYLDIALCQIDPPYCRALSAYQKVLSQRNSLLKSLRDQEVRAPSTSANRQLEYWDTTLAQHGAIVLARRQNYVTELNALARRRHNELTGGRETLRVEYLPSFSLGPADDDEFRRWKTGEAALPQAGMDEFVADSVQIAERFVEKITRRRSRELAAGITLYGPHRDDLRLLADGRDLRAYGSRGQQRSAAVALKLAEMYAMTEATGTAPVLLLDDVMSELDAKRRNTLLAALNGVNQAILTTTDWDDFALDFRKSALCLQVRAGDITLAADAVEDQ
jgi:DNA replication and repair protein RecF